MKKNKSAFLSLTLMSLLVCCFLVGITPRALALTQEPKVENKDVVYSENEVDVKAEITNLAAVNPIRSGASIDCKGTVEVQLTMVLRKTGKVSDVKIVKTANCSLDRKAIQSVKRIKFKAAEKNGVAVSQLSEIAFRQNRVY